MTQDNVIKITDAGGFARDRISFDTTNPTNEQGLCVKAHSEDPTGTIHLHLTRHESDALWQLLNAIPGRCKASQGGGRVCGSTDPDTRGHYHPLGTHTSND